MLIELKYIFQIMSTVILILFLISYIISGLVVSKVKKLPQELGEEYEKERAKLEGKQLLSTLNQLILFAITTVYLLFSIIMPNNVKNLVGGDTNYSAISFIITLIVVVPIGIRSYKNIKVWNNFKKKE